MAKPIIIRTEADRENAARLVSGLNIARPWEMTIEPHKKRRTLSQNALLWKWLGEVAKHVSDHTGMDTDEIHEFFKAKFLPPKVISIAGEEAFYRTTTKLSVQEMTTYMNQIYAFVTSNLGVMLPVPEALHEAA